MVVSAGVLLYRRAVMPVGPDPARPLEPPEVLIAHMGGPFWAGRTAAAWSIPKGEYDPDAEDALAAARREFTEELGVPPPEVEYVELGVFRYSSGKRVTVFTADGADFAPHEFHYGTFELEWPPRSGRQAAFPEVDEARWVPLAEARELLVKGQRPVLDALESQLASQ